MGIVVTSCVAGPYQKVTTQIPIAQLTSLTARLPPAVSSLEACQTPALEFARRLTSLQLKAGILQPLTTSDVPVLQSVLTLSATSFRFLKTNEGRFHLSKWTFTDKC